MQCGVCVTPSDNTYKYLHGRFSRPELFLSSDYFLLSSLFLTLLSFPFVSFIFVFSLRHTSLGCFPVPGSQQSLEKVNNENGKPGKDNNRKCKILDTPLQKAVKLLCAGNWRVGFPVDGSAEEKGIVYSTDREEKSTMHANKN